MKIFFRSSGGIEAEQAMRAKLNKEEENVIFDSVNALIKLRQKRNKQVTLPIPKDNVDDCGATDKLIISKDYYDDCDSSDDSIEETDKQNRSSHEISSDSENDCSDNGSVKTSPLICEIKDRGENHSKDDGLVQSINQQLWKPSVVVELTQKEGNDEFQISHNSIESQSSIDLSNKQAEKFLENKTMNIPTETRPEHFQILNPTNSTESISFNVEKESNEGNGDNFGKKDFVLNKENNDDEDRGMSCQSYHNTSIDGCMDTITIQNDKLFSDKTVEKCNIKEEIMLERLNNLEVTVDNMGIEYNLSIHKPNIDKNDDISIKLPWKQLDKNEEFHIRKSFE